MNVTSIEKCTAVILLPGTEPLTREVTRFEEAQEWLLQQYGGFARTRVFAGECHALIIDGATGRTVAAWHGQVGHIADELAEASQQPPHGGAQAPALGLVVHSGRDDTP